MGRKCSVGYCTTGYRSNNETKIPVYRFPSDPEECKLWLSKLPNTLTNVTNNMGICKKHWPENASFIMLYGKSRPQNPPSIFSGCPVSNMPQSSRNTEQRGVLSSQKSVKQDELAQCKEVDIIENFDLLKFNLPTSSLVCDRKLLFKISDDGFHLYVLNDHEVKVHIVILNTLSVQAYVYRKSVDIRKYLDFQCKLNYWSQLDAIVNYCKQYEASDAEKLEYIITQLRSLSTDRPNFYFICELLRQCIAHPNSRGYSFDFMINCCLLFIANRNAYSITRSMLPMPHPNTLRKLFFGNNFSDTGPHSDCESMLQTMFKKLVGHQKLVSLLFDEVSLKASFRFRGNHIVARAEDDESKVAKTMLAVMVKPLMGGQSFICRLCPVYSLTSDFLQKVMVDIQQIHQCGGSVVSTICDNNAINVAFYSSMMIMHPSSISSSASLANFCNSDIHLLYDSARILKNIRNNWITEKEKIIEFYCPTENRVLVAKWSHIESLYNSEKGKVVKMSKLSYASVFPAPIQRQNVNLALQVFNDSTCAALAYMKFTDTCAFVAYVIRFWETVNGKRNDESIINNDINDRSSTSLTIPVHKRLLHLVSFRNSVERMRGGIGRARRRSFTSETRNAIIKTIDGLCSLSHYLLTEKKFEYVMLGHFQSDPLEGEFGFNGQLSAGNYLVAAEQIFQSASFRRLKIFHALEIADYAHEKQACCDSDFSDVELLAMDLDLDDESLDGVSSEELSSLYYICGYIAHKEGLSGDVTEMFDKYSEFTDFINRGKLTYPPEWFFLFSVQTYRAFKFLARIDCKIKLKKLFMHMFDTYVNVVMDSANLCERLCNIYLKGFSKLGNDDSVVNSKYPKQRKIAKLSFM